MNLRNRYAVITVRTLYGLMMLFSGVSGFMALRSGSMEGIPEAMRVITQSLVSSGLFQMIKVTEIVAGLMLVAGFLPALAVIFLAPIGVGVVVFNSQVAPNLIVSGLIVCAFEAYFGYVYWDQYKALFARK